MTVYIYSLIAFEILLISLFLGYFLNGHLKSIKFNVPRFLLILVVAGFTIGNYCGENSSIIYLLNVFVIALLCQSIASKFHFFITFFILLSINFGISNLRFKAIFTSSLTSKLRLSSERFQDNYRLKTKDSIRDHLFSTGEKQVEIDQGFCYQTEFSKEYSPTVFTLPKFKHFWHSPFTNLYVLDSFKLQALWYEGGTSTKSTINKSLIWKDIKLDGFSMKDLGFNGCSATSNGSYTNIVDLTTCN